MAQANAAMRVNRVMIFFAIPSFCGWSVFVR